MTRLEAFGPIAICTDCLMLAANGWESSDPMPPELTDNPDARAGWRLEPGGRCEHCQGADDECESWFSWSPCDYCRRPLGGDRSHGTLCRDVCGARCRFCSLTCERRPGHYPATAHECQGETWEDSHTLPRVRVS